MPLDEELVQVFKTAALTCNGHIRRDGSVAHCPCRLLHCIHLTDDLTEQLLIYFPVMPKGYDLSGADDPCQDKQPHHSHGCSGRKYDPRGRQAIGKRQKDRCEDPEVLPDLVLIVDISAPLIIPQGIRRHSSLDPCHGKRDQDTEPDRHSSLHSEQKRKRQKAHDHLQYHISVIDQRIFPGIHAELDHGIIFIPRRIKQTGIHVRSDHGQ